MHKESPYAPAFDRRGFFQVVIQARQLESLNTAGVTNRARGGWPVPLYESGRHRRINQPAHALPRN
jgi:hypothetical protein